MSLNQLSSGLKKRSILSLFLLFFAIGLFPLFSFSQPVGAYMYNPIVMGNYSGGTFTYSDTKNNTGYVDNYGQQSEDIFYQFTVQGSTWIDISHCGSNIDTYMYLLNSSGDLITSNDDNGPLCGGTTASIRITLEAGTYYIVSEGYGSNSGNITTSATLTVEAPPTAVVNEDKNLIRTWEATAPFSDPDALISKGLRQVKQSTTYFDGLGRPEQTVIKLGSLSGGGNTDLVSAIVYDEFGREAQKYLPYVASTSDGLYKADPLTDQNSFYSGTSSPIAGQSETHFYGKTDFEPSPLNRTVKTYGPGNSWVGAGRGVETKYYINTGLDAVRIWTITDGAFGTLGTYASTTTYPAGELYKNITVDENQNQVIEFKDKGGKVILKKVQLTAAADDGTGSGHAGWLCTYYIYDDFNNLRCMIQPRGIELISSDWLLTDATILAEQCFRYEYDQRQRMIIKKVPVAGEVNMVYDAWDRLIMTQDANLKVNNNYLVTKYDALNRPVETGIWTNTNTVASHRDAAKEITDYPATSSNYELLTQTYYDDYNWISPSGSPITNTSYETSWDTYLNTASTTVFPYPVANAKSLAIKGMVTGTRTKVLGTSSYIYSMMIYDEKGRVIQLKSTNVTSSSGNYDVATTQYGWQGLPLITVQKQQKSGSNPQTITIVTKNNYDNLGRIIKIEKRQANSLLNGGAMSAYATIGQMEYDALGQLKSKKLAPAYNNNTGLETLTYDYNIRGWLLSANRDYITQSATPADKHFAFDLSYDKNGILGTYNPQYNGNISGMIWKSAGDGERRKYDFNYDAVNRLMKADFNQYTAGTFNKTANTDFTVKMGDGTDPLTAYDANGNIKAMTQSGLKINSSSNIDVLNYTYQANSNKLLQVTDAANDYTSTLADFKYDPATKGATDYAYDANGNLTLDNNKKISGITYNYLNLPSVITVAGKGTITHTYDAAGNKLKKVTVDNTVSPAKTTTTLYIGGAIYENDQLQFIAHEEGRIRPKRDANNNITYFVYDYFLKDHLGNVRMVLTEEKKTDIYPAASLEDAKIATEQNYYTINTSQVVDKSVATGIPNYQNNNVIPNPPVNASFDNANSVKLYVLNKNSQKTGLGITLKVMSGDKIDIYGKSYYFQNNTGGPAANSTVPIIDILSGFIGSPSGAVSALHGGVTAAQLNGITATTIPINSLLANQTTDNNATPTKPKAFINYILFDEQLKGIASGFAPVGDNAVLTDYASSPILHNIPVTNNGFVYIWCSNESPVDVFFDNLQVVHTRGAMLEETHYYPFGLTMAGISSKAALGLENKYKYNGKELQHNEFSDNSGLEMYDFHARMYDQQTGHFPNVDRLASEFPWQSPYVAFDNNPINLIDPDGRAAMSPDLEVEMQKDGSYNVTGGTANADKNIYVMENGKRTGEVLGQMLTEYSFHHEDGSAVVGANINLNDQSGQNFFNNEIKNIGLFDYIGNAKGGEPLDFKHRGINDRNEGTTVSQHHYRGMSFEGKIASARDIGNYAAGYVAGVHGFGWGTSRFAFDALQTKQEKGTWNTVLYYPFNRVREGQPTQRAERAGHNVGYPIFKQRQFEREWKKVINPWPTGPKW